MKTATILRCLIDPSNEEVVEKYIGMASKLNSLKKDNLNSTLIHSFDATIAHRTENVSVKLPPLPIPTFNGAYEEWQSFRNNWQSIIDSQNGLSNIVKMHYLKSHVSGSALSVVKNYQTQKLHTN